MNTDRMCSQFESEGFVLAAQVLDTASLTAARACVHAIEAEETEHKRGDKVFAARDVFAQHPELLKIASSGPLLDIARALAGPDARPTKATIFDKRPEANWTLPLHQDLTITVRNRADVPGYTHWSTKAGVPHVQPPVAILEQIVALRVHLDDCPVENGALEVVPGSHRMGRISAQTLQAMHRDNAMVPCPASAGDTLAMRPLLVHGSSKALVPGRRRVLHVEYSACELDAPLEWPDWTLRD